MKERPILFSTAMVQAILNGTKTQTRRTKGLETFNEQPDNWKWTCTLTRPNEPAAGRHAFFIDEAANKEVALGAKCPYGVEGDILWVRETWAYSNGIEPYGREYIYKADLVGDNVATTSYRFSFDDDELDSIKYKPSIHMPREASRILLEITKISVERLQDICSADAREEGVIEPDSLRGIFDDGGTIKSYKFGTHPAPVHFFYELWESINGLESWQHNPWVWVVEFKVIQPCTP